MKNLFALFLVLVSINCFSQSAVPVNLTFQTVSTVPDSAFYTSAAVQLGRPYVENNISFVNIYVTQEDRRSEADIRTRKVTIKAPAGILSQVLVFDPLTLTVTVNKTALALLLAANGIKTQVQ